MRRRSSCCALNATCLRSRLLCSRLHAVTCCSGSAMSAARCRASRAALSRRRRHQRVTMTTSSTPAVAHASSGTQNWLVTQRQRGCRAAAIRKPPRILRARRFHRLARGCGARDMGPKRGGRPPSSHRRHRQRALRPRHALVFTRRFTTRARVRRLAPARGAGSPPTTPRRSSGEAALLSAGPASSSGARALRGARAPAVGALPRVRPLRLADGPPLLAPPLLRRRRQPACLLAADRPRARDQRLLPGARDLAAARRRVRRALVE